MSATAPTLKAPSVDEAPDGVLNPETLPPTGAKVRVPHYDGMAFRDEVTAHIGHFTDTIPISQSAVGKDVEFIVQAKEFIANDNNIVPIRYEVQRHQGALEESLTLELRLDAGFESDAHLDLSAENYVASVDKAPMEIPAFARMTREAKWGQGPYVYSSSDERIASVKPTSGEVTALRNGACTITATDAQNRTQSYVMTISGIQELHFLSTGADWEGMKVLCMQAKVQPVTLAQIKRLWSLYYPSSGQVAVYLGWLHYPIWTGDALGAGTAWSYDLDGSNVNDNARGDDVETFHQVVGIKRA